MKNILFLLLLFVSLCLQAYSQDKDNGIIKGKVIDEEIQSPVEGAVVEILNSELKTGTDKNGEFIFENLQFNSYQIKISAIGYNPIIKSDLVVHASKSLQLTITLIPKGYETEVIDVEANFFQQNSDINISSLNLDFEEIRRAPGASEDISRMLQTAPGVTIGNDQRNDLIVRGGSPSENLILIDGIEFPNINHFGTQGSTSGAIGFINANFILESDILTGGFPSLYGDRLSSVVDISFREGNKKRIYSDINLSMAGFGGMLEGPLTEKGSFLFSVRRSYLELLHSAIRLSAVPNYWDFNLKTVYDIDENNKLSLIGLMGLDKIDLSGDTDDENPYGDANSNQKSFATGVNYRRIFDKGFLQTILSNTFASYNSTQREKESDEIRFDNNSFEDEITLKTDLNYQLSRKFILNAGVGGKYVFIKNNLYLKGDTSYAGYIYETIDANNEENTYKLFTHLNLTSKLLDDKLIINSGLRFDYFDYIRLKSTVSPRIGLSYKLTGITSLNATYGIFYQSPTYLWVTSHPNNVNLNSIRSDHYILGIEHFFRSDLRATVEIYEKRYKDYPVWKDIPTYILIDGGADFGPNLVGEAVSAGRGYVRGIDISIHKKLSNHGLYGMINYSYSHSRFTALEGGEKPGAFDPTHQFTLISGYQFASDWLVGFKFKYAGGKPYTPIDENASRLVGRGVFATDDFNSERYPYYMRIDLRVDKKTNFKSATLIGYIELQNILNRDNIFSYFWNKDKNELGTIYQWSFFVVGGVSIQF